MKKTMKQAACVLMAAMVLTACGSSGHYSGPGGSRDARGEGRSPGGSGSRRL